MRARLVLEIMGDDGEMIAMETVADLVKVTKGAEDLGLSLSEAKGLLTKLQQAMVETQVELWLSENRELDGRRLRSKGSYPITFHTLFWGRPPEKPPILPAALGRRKRSSNDLSTPETDPRPHCARAPLSGNAVGIARALCRRGRAAGRCAAGRERRQRHDGSAARLAGRQAHRAGTDRRAGFLHAGCLSARLDEPARSRWPHRHRSGWRVYP